MDRRQVSNTYDENGTPITTVVDYGGMVELLRQHGGH
jgi:hypothetical protein